MSGLPAHVLLPGAFLCAMVLWLSVLFLFAPERGLAFSTHRREDLATVLGNRFLSTALIMAGALAYGWPEVVAFVFAASGISPLHDAWIYARRGKPFAGHLFSAVLSAAVAIAATVLYLNAGAA